MLHICMSLAIHTSEQYHVQSSLVGGERQDHLHVLTSKYELDQEKSSRPITSYTFSAHNNSQSQDIFQSISSFYPVVFCLCLTNFSIIAILLKLLLDKIMSDNTRVLL